MYIGISVSTCIYKIYIYIYVHRSNVTSADYLSYSSQGLALKGGLLLKPDFGEHEHGTGPKACSK